MANEEHLKILRQGAEVWNQWRINNLLIIPDLSGADLSHTNLIGADSNRADLRYADFRNADFMVAKFIKEVIAGSYECVDADENSFIQKSLATRRRSTDCT